MAAGSKKRITLQEKTLSEVIAQIEEAVRTLRHLPNRERLGRASAWPEYVQTFADCIGVERVTHYRPVITPRQISRMDEVIDWLTLVPPETSKIIWARAEGFAWRQIGRIVGLGKDTCISRFTVGIVVIAFNARKKPLDR